MGTAQGVTYNQAATALLVEIFDGTNPPILHLFVSDDTPAVGDLPSAQYTEAFGPNYSPLVVGPGFIVNVGGFPPLYALLGAAFPNVGPLTPGADTVFGWWIDQPTTSSPLALFGGRFATPIVLNMAGQSLDFDTIDLPLHDCNTIPYFSLVLLDPWFQIPPTTGVPPLNFEYQPGGGDWTFTQGPGLGGAGILGVNSAFTPPNPIAGLFQCCFLQGQGSVSQAFAGPGGSYQVAILAANRVAGGSQTVKVFLDNNLLGTISAWPSAWQLWSSSSFTMGSGSHTIALVGQTLDPPTDDTLFIGHVEIVPWPHL